MAGTLLWRYAAYYFQSPSFKFNNQVKYNNCLNEGQMGNYPTFTFSRRYMANKATLAATAAIK